MKGWYGKKSERFVGCVCGRGDQDCWMMEMLQVTTKVTSSYRKSEQP